MRDEQKKDMPVDISLLDPRLQALDKFLTEQRKSRRWLGLQIQRGPNIVQKWFERNFWPKREESRIEEVLGLDKGEFERIHKTGHDGDGEQKEHTQIVNLAPAIDQIQISLEQYRELLQLAPSDPEMAERLERVRSHLRNQISLLLELSIPQRAQQRKGRKKPENN